MSNVEASTIWPQVVTGIFAIAGGISSGLIVWLTSKQTLAQQQRVAAEQRKLERLEELYVLFTAWTDDLSVNYILYVQKLRGIFTAAEHLENLKKRKENSKADVKRMSMIIDIHVPELQEHLAKVLEIRDKSANFLLSKEQKDLSEFFKIQRDWEPACEAFKKALADRTRR